MDEPSTTLAKRQTRQITTEYVDALKAYSEVLYKGGLCPVFKKGPAARSELVAAIIEIGKDIGLSPTQSLASVLIVNGRPSIFGDAALSLVRASGLLEDFEETIEGDGEKMVAVCRVKRKGSKRDHVERYSVADAKQAKLWGNDGPWQTAPKRMLKFRARSFALRDEFGDVLAGLLFVEEAEDLPPMDVRYAAPMQVSTVPPPAIPAEQPAALPAAPTREERLQHLAHARAVAFAALGVADDEAASAKWAEILAPFGGVKASQLDDAKLEELIVAVEKLADPSHGRSGT